MHCKAIAVYVAAKLHMNVHSAKITTLAKKQRYGYAIQQRAKCALQNIWQKNIVLVDTIMKVVVFY